MDYNDHYSATKDAIIDALASVKPPPRMMRIDAFDAEDEDGETVRVIGVAECQEDDILKFIVIETDEDGQVYPIVRTTIYRKAEAPTA